MNSYPTKAIMKSSLKRSRSEDEYAMTAERLGFDLPELPLEIQAMIWKKVIISDLGTFTARSYLDLTLSKGTLGRDGLDFLLRTNNRIWKMWCVEDFGNLFDGRLPVWISQNPSEDVIPWRRCYIWFLYFFRTCVKYLCRREIYLATNGTNWEEQIDNVLSQHDFSLPRNHFIEVFHLTDIDYNNFLMNPNKNPLVLKFSNSSEEFCKWSDIERLQIFTYANNYWYSFEPISSIADMVACTLGDEREVVFGDVADYLDLAERFEFEKYFEKDDATINIRNQKEVFFNFIIWSVWTTHGLGNKDYIEQVCIPILHSLPIQPKDEKLGKVYIGSQQLNCLNCDSTNREILLCSKCLGE